MGDRQFAVSVPADAACLKAIRAFFRELLQDAFGDETDRLVLALDEACSNFLKHRCRQDTAGCLRVCAETAAGVLRFRISDFCDREDVPRIRPRDLESVRPGGLGTHYIQSIMDGVRFEPEQGRAGAMTLVLEKRLPRPRVDAGSGEA